VAELPEDEVGADDKVSGDFTLNAEAEVCGGDTGEVRRVNRALLIYLEIRDGKILVARITAKLSQIRPDDRQNLQEIRPGECGWI